MRTNNNLQGLKTCVRTILIYLLVQYKVSAADLFSSPHFAQCRTGCLRMTQFVVTVPS
jgi:hypothetical protein